MHGQEFFFQAFVYLCAAVISVPIAKKIGLGSVLGYLIAGAVIGPYAIGLVGAEGEDVMHFAEFGVVMMLFLVGLELKPSLLWKLRGPILGTGGSQVVITAALLAAAGLGLGYSWQTSLALGLILSLSSTAMVLQTLNEKGLMKTDAGQTSFSVLLFQDIAVIPMLAILPLLATSHGTTHDDHHGADHHTTWVEGLSPWAQTLAVLGAVAVIILAGLFLARPALRMIAASRMREIFTAAALVLVIGIALLMAQVGLSPALGTFLAGVVLANSEYRHELESDIEPFKGLLLGVFFIAVGASIDFYLIAAQPAKIIGLMAGLMLLKFAVLLAIGRFSKMSLSQNVLFACALAQGGEFAFVLFSFATQNAILAADVIAPMIAAVALSMGMTPIVMLVFERIVQPRLEVPASSLPADTIDSPGDVIIAGFGRFGNIVGRMLSANGVRTTVLDVDSDHVDLLRKIGLRVFYGDASRRELLAAAGADTASLLIVAVDNPDKCLQIVEVAQKHFPRLPIMSRAAGRTHAYQLLDAGVSDIHRETLDSSLSMARDALKHLGLPAHQANRAAQRFRRHDEKSVRTMATMRQDRKAYIRQAREEIAEIESLLREELRERDHAEDSAWDTSGIRADPTL